MAKARVLKVVNFRQEDIPVLEALEKILRRDGKEFSEWAREKAIEYVRAHSEGNDIIPLSKFAENPEIIALPTMGEPIKPTLSDDSLEAILKAASARLQEAEFIARRRGWWVDDRVGQFERRRRDGN